MQLNDELCTLNVGGVIHTTALSTLRRYPDSMLAKMFSSNIPPSRLMDSSGNIFIDRDGVQFTHILNFLRSGILTLPDNFSSFHSLEIEADYYGLDELIDLLKNKETIKSSYGGFIIEIIEFEEASSFMKFYGRSDLEGILINDWKHMMNNGALLITGPEDLLNQIPTIKFRTNTIGKYIVKTTYKMELFNFLNQRSWKLTHAPINFDSDSGGSYIIRQYIWQLM